MPVKGIANDKLANADTKTQIAQGYDCIPKGAEVEILDADFHNLYGHFYEVKWNGHIYYVRPEKITVTERK